MDLSNEEPLEENTPGRRLREQFALMKWSGLRCLEGPPTTLALLFNRRWRSGLHTPTQCEYIYLGSLL